jgi:hypothetical protein
MERRREAKPTDSEAPVMVGTQGSMRGTNVAWLLVRPFQWKAATKQLTRISRIKVRIELEPARETEALVRERIVPEWEDATTAVAPVSAIPKGGATPFKPTQLPSVLGSPVAYVIVTNDALAAEFQRLADWKTESGVPAVVRTLTTIRQEYAGTDDADRVRRFLRDAYTRWGTKWALLGGDTDVIPTRVAWTTFYTDTAAGVQRHPDRHVLLLPRRELERRRRQSLRRRGPLAHHQGGRLRHAARDLRGTGTRLPPRSRPIDSSTRCSSTRALRSAGTSTRFCSSPRCSTPRTGTPGTFIYLDGADMAEECLPSLKTNPAISYTRYYENYLDSSYESGALRARPATRC